MGEAKTRKDLGLPPRKFKQDGSISISEVMDMETLKCDCGGETMEHGFIVKVIPVTHPKNPANGVPTRVVVDGLVCKQCKKFFMASV